MLFVEVTDSPFEHLFTYMEFIVDVLRRRFVGERAVAVMIEEVLMKAFREIKCLLPSLLLQHNVKFPVRAYCRNKTFQAVARMQFAEDLVVIDKSLEFVVHNNFEPKVCLLPHKDFHFVILLIFREIL